MNLIFGGGTLAEAINELYPSKIISYKDCDVTNYSEVKRIIDKYKPKTVINCAGVFNRATIEDSDYGEWVKDVETNLFGSYYVSKASSGVEKVILIGSIAGRNPKEGQSAYSVAKAGVRMLVGSLHKEGREAYCISPTRIQGPMRDKIYPKEDKKTQLEPKDVAKHVVNCLNGTYPSGSEVLVVMKGYEKRFWVEEI